MAASMMHASRVGFGATSGSAATVELDFLSCNVAKQGSHIQSEGIRGLRDYISELVNEGTFTVGGSLVMHPRPSELDLFLPQIMGGGTNPTYTLAETQTSFGIDVTKIGQICRYAGLKVNSAVFRCAPNQPLTLEMDLQGTTETTGISFPALTNVSNVAPYIFSELVLTLGGVAYQCFNIEIGIQNNLLLDRFMNTQSRTELPEQSRVITLNATVQMTSVEAAALYDTAVAGITGTAVWTKGAYGLTFSFDKLQKPISPVVIANRNGEITLGLQFTARHNATTPTKALIVTNDSTP